MTGERSIRFFTRLSLENSSDVSIVRKTIELRLALHGNRKRCFELALQVLDFQQTSIKFTHSPFSRPSNLDLG